MNSALFSKFLALSLILTVGAVGCKKIPRSPTPIPGPTRTTGPGPGPGPNSGPIVGPGGNAVPVDVDPRSIRPGDDLTGGTTLGGREELDNFWVDRETFKQQTVYFEFDRSTVQPADKGKVEAVAAYLKSNPTHKLLIEGHCDERGTPEYNRSLGERRALSVREYLIALGIAPERASTVSFGEDKPAVLGSDEAAWTKNRRGEFVLLKPKT